VYACWELGCLRVLRAWGRLGLIRLPPYGSRHLHDRTLTHAPTVLPASQLSYSGVWGPPPMSVWAKDMRGARVCPQKVLPISSPSFPSPSCMIQARLPPPSYVLGSHVSSDVVQTSCKVKHSPEHYDGLKSERLSRGGDIPRLPHGEEVHGVANSIAVLRYQLRQMQVSHNARGWVVRHSPMLDLESR